jgi:hypothetical protein
VNCVLNERSFFSLPEVKAEFAKYTLLKMYTDTVPKRYYPPEQAKAVTRDKQIEDAEANKAFQQQQFNTAELPLYVVIEPTETGFKELGRYNVGLIRDKQDFLKFLRDHAQ